MLSTPCLFTDGLHPSGQVLFQSRLLPDQLRHMGQNGCTMLAVRRGRGSSMNQGLPLSEKISDSLQTLL
jgi:hypothetical protein